jgi:hypothetical protein
VKFYAKIWGTSFKVIYYYLDFGQGEYYAQYTPSITYVALNLVRSPTWHTGIVLKYHIQDMK